MKVCLDDLSMLDTWTNIYAKHLEYKWTDCDWKRLFNENFPDVVATTDVPCCDFAIELAHAFPDAKVPYLIIVYPKFRDIHIHFFVSDNFTMQGC